MKKFTFLSIFSLVFLFAFSQKNYDSAAVEKWKLSYLNGPNFVKSNISELRNYDLSDLFANDVDDLPLGFIGDKYERFEIFYTSVKKNPANSDEYLVTGKNRVNATICDFTGTITLTDVGYYSQKSDWGNYPDSVKLGMLIGNYNFTENKKEHHVGTLNGYVAVRYYITPSNKVLTDDFNNTSDSYYNNQYVGYWKSYDGKTIKACNWGNNRIPQCGDLDTGKKDFFPADKYVANGWDKYPSLLNTIWWK